MKTWYDQKKELIYKFITIYTEWKGKKKTTAFQLDVMRKIWTSDNWKQHMSTIYINW